MGLLFRSFMGFRCTFKAFGGARFLEPLIIFKGRGKVRGAIALLKRDALLYATM
jgi:hypothetical protein